MKNKLTFSLMVLALLFGFMSCSDKEDDLTGNQAKEALIGKWALLSFTDEEGTEDYEHECNTKKDYIEFKNDNTFLDVFYNEDCTQESTNSTYSVNENKLTIEGQTTYTFKISGKKLQMEGGGEIVHLEKQ